MKMGECGVKKIIGFTAVMLMIAAVMAMNLYGMKTASPTPGNLPDTQADVLDSFFEFKAADIEKIIRENERIRFSELGGSTRKQIEETLTKLSKGEITLRKVFSSTYFVGDSLMNGLEVYNILNPDRLVTQVSASLYHLSDNVNKIISANPEVLILHYGVNMISTEKADRDSFISQYTELVNRLKKALPDCRIIISGLFPVDRTVATEERFGQIFAYNKELLTMCEKLGVEFLDSTEMMQSCKDYYGGDGIHLSAAFYSDKWLPFIVESKGIIG